MAKSSRNACRVALHLCTWISLLVLLIVGSVVLGGTRRDFGFAWRGNIAVVTAAALGVLLIPILAAVVNPTKGVSGGAGAELAALLILWFLLLGGAITLSRQWPSSSFCRYTALCRTLRSTQAWSWISWILVSMAILADIALLATSSPSSSTYETRPATTTTPETRNRDPAVGLHATNGATQAADSTV